MTAGARFAKWGLGLFIFGARTGLHWLSPKDDNQGN